MKLVATAWQGRFALVASKLAGIPLATTVEGPFSINADLDPPALHGARLRSNTEEVSVSADRRKRDRCGCVALLALFPHIPRKP